MGCRRDTVLSTWHHDIRPFGSIFPPDKAAALEAELAAQMSRISSSGQDWPKEFGIFYLNLEPK